MIRHAHHAVAAAVSVLQPLGDWHSWVTVRDYPIDAVLAAQEGITGFALPIDANGLPTECKITKTSGSKILDDQTCAIMLIRARFRPPVNKKGQPIPATYHQAIRWRLPPAAKPELVVDRSFEALSTIAPNGNVIDCQLSGPGAARLGLARGSCGPFGERAFLSGLLKDNYAKTRTADVRLTITFEGAPPLQVDKTPNLLIGLAKATIDVGTDGSTTGCTTVSATTAMGSALDLCDLVKGEPQHYPPQPQPRKATMQLDLSAFYE